ncbi:MAG TPA: thiamine phosphate synthase [Desulfobulbaceae bacterium]|nr:thiamine phosphate synthase [Desulfobulbaceae bacterium]
MKDTSRYAQRMQQFVERVDIYPVSCERLAGGRSDREWLGAVLAGGARIVQLRDKGSSDRELLAKAHYFRRKTREAGALFIVNDRLDIALLSKADGIHLGQNDLPPEAVRSLAPDMIIGLSCNTEEQARQLGLLEQQGACPVSYYNIGPLYATGTKEGLVRFLGPDAIECFSRHSRLPFTVMGGIKAEHIDVLVRLGARCIAVVTAISQAKDITCETSQLRERIIEARSRQING